MIEEGVGFLWLGSCCRGTLWVVVVRWGMDMAWEGNVRRRRRRVYEGWVEGMEREIGTGWM